MAEHVQALVLDELVHLRDGGMGAIVRRKRLLRPPVLHQLHGAEKTDRTHIANADVSILHAVQQHGHVLAGTPRPLHNILLFQHLQCSDACCQTQRVACS